MNIKIEIPIQGVQTILASLSQNKDSIDALIRSIVEQSNAQIRSEAPPDETAADK